MKRPRADFEVAVDRGDDVVTLGIVIASDASAGCRYTANGDGWPPEDPELECVYATDEDDKACSTAMSEHEHDAAVERYHEGRDHEYECAYGMAK